MADIIPITMQGAGIAGITLFISLFAIIYPKSESENAKEILENHILFKEVFLIKYFIIIIPGIYAPFLLWDIEPIRIILFIISAIFISILFKIIFNMIRWIFTGAENDIDGDVDSDDNNYKNKLIRKYLTSFQKSDKAPKFYAALFGKKYSDNQAYTEVKYFNYFLKFLDKIYAEEKKKQPAEQYKSDSVFAKSLRTYYELIENRNLKNPRLLYHFTEKWIEMFFKYYDKEDNKPGKKYNGALIGIIKKHIEVYYKMDWDLLIALIQNGIRDKEENKGKEFLKFFVIDIFFNEPEIWQGDLFPEEWKMKIVEKENIYAVYWLDEFWNKNLENPRPYHDGYDIKETKQQQLILEGLFVDKIDPEIFSYFYRIIDPYYNRILNSAFYKALSPNVNSNNYEEIISNHYMKWLVEEHKHDFYDGMPKILATTMSYSSSSSKPTQEDHFQIEKDAIKRMEQATFKAFWGYYRYPSLQQPAVEKYIAELNKLSYDEEKNPVEFHRRKRLLHILSEWLDYYKKKEKEEKEDKEKKDKEKSDKQLVVKE